MIKTHRFTRNADSDKPELACTVIPYSGGALPNLSRALIRGSKFEVGLLISPTKTLKLGSAST